MIGGSSWCKCVCVCAASVYWPSDSKGGGQRRSDPNSQERRSEFPFSATPSIVFLFNERWAIGPGWGREEGGEPEPWEPSTSSLTSGMDGQEGRGLMSRAWTVPCSQQSNEDSGYLAWKGKGGDGGGGNGWAFLQEHPHCHVSPNGTWQIWENGTKAKT